MLTLPSLTRPGFGPATDFTYFGDYGQGIGGVKYQGPTSDPNDPQAKALAGFLNPAAPTPADSGSWSYQGYAAAFSQPATYAGPSYSYSSADPASDLVGGNEGRARVALNKDAFQNNATLAIDVRRNPSAAVVPGQDLFYGAPDFSAYVENNYFGAEYNSPDFKAQLRNPVSGDNWTWGEWDGEREVDLGGGATGTDYVHGEFAAGQTLTPAAFQSLVSGGASYNLHTPAGGQNFASANVVRGNPLSRLQGGCMLNVNIPGGGATPVWSGSFNLTGSGTDALQFQVPTTSISPNGHLRGAVGTYSLIVGGVGYTAGSLLQQSMSGNLVGPGTGSRPITGAVGSGRFLHSDGTEVTLTYGTDLAP